MTEWRGSTVLLLLLSVISLPQVDMNAQQLHLTGCVMLYQDINLVVVEGGPKCLKKFKRLMMQRIKWNPEKKKRRGDGEPSGLGLVPRPPRSYCRLQYLASFPSSPPCCWKD